MPAQDDANIFLLKLWPQIEANKNRIVAGAVIAAIAIAAIWIFNQQRGQKEITAGEALTKLTLSQTAQPEAFLKIATDYSGTAAGQRALLQGATAFFVAGKYADAQTQFQKYLTDHPDGEFAGQAALGVAASLEAQGKTDDAATAFQRAMNSSEPAIASAAKLGLAKILEAQGKYDIAQNDFEEVARANQNNSIGNDAMWHYMQLKNKMPVSKSVAAPATAPAIPLQSVK